MVNAGVWKNNSDMLAARNLRREQKRKRGEGEPTGAHLRNFLDFDWLGQAS